MKALVLSALGILAANSFTYADPQIDAYLRAVARGEAGVNPRDQTAARRGDPYAQARIQGVFSFCKVRSLSPMVHSTLLTAAASCCKVHSRPGTQ